MVKADILNMNGAQAVKIPDALRIDADAVWIRRQGDGLVIEPVKPHQWPAGFFDAIHITDPTFDRPPQGQMPPAPKLA